MPLSFLSGFPSVYKTEINTPPGSLAQGVGRTKNTKLRYVLRNMKGKTIQPLARFSKLISPTKGESGKTATAIRRRKHCPRDISKAAIISYSSSLYVRMHPSCLRRERLGSSPQGEGGRRRNSTLQFSLAHKFNTVSCIAGVVVDMYGLHGTKRDQGARWAGLRRLLRRAGYISALHGSRVPNGMGALGG